MIMLKSFIMGEISWPRPRKNRTNQPGERTSDTACRLNVFRSILWLTIYSHNSKAVHINANRKHVCGQDNIHRLNFSFGKLFLKLDFKLIQFFGNLFIAYTGCQFIYIENATHLKTRTFYLGCESNPERSSLNIVFRQTSHAAKLTQ